MSLLSKTMNIKYTYKFIYADKENRQIKRKIRLQYYTDDFNR